MAIDKGFRRIVLTLMTLVTISVITVGVYLYFNFKSRSSLPVIVPQGTTQMMHFQTRKMRDESEVSQPKFMDSLAQFIAESPVFKHLEKPSDAGIALYSDLVFFDFQGLHCLALTLNSEQRFSTLLDTLKRKGFVGGQVKKEAYNYVKVLNTPWYIAYKYKAMVLINPEVENAQKTVETDPLENSLQKIFEGKGKGLISDPKIQALYDAECQWLAFKEGRVCGFAFDQGQSISLMGDTQKAEVNNTLTTRMFEEMRLAMGETSTEKKNITGNKDQGVFQLETYFESLFNYLKNGKYRY